MTHAKVIGARLRQARGDRPVAEVADAIGITTQTLYRWETGAISVPPARYGAVAAALEAPWEELFAPLEVSA